MKLGIRLRYGFIIGAIVVVISIILTSVLLVSFRSSNHELTSSNEAAVTAYTTRQAIINSREITKQLATYIANPLYYYDTHAIGQLLDIAAAHPNVSQVQVLDKDRTLVLDSNNAIKGIGQAVDFGPEESWQMGNGAVHRVWENKLDVFAPVRLATETIGFVWFTMSLEAMRLDITDQKSDLQYLASKNTKDLIQQALLLSSLMLLLGLMIAAVVSKHFTRPIDMLVEFAKRLGDGDFQARTQLTRNDELGELSHQLNLMASDMQSHNEQLQYLADYDTLTKLPNRRHFKHQVTKLIQEIESSNTAYKNFALLFIDVDDFKLINDVHGHTVGDAAITQIAGRLEQCLRQAQHQNQDIRIQFSRFAGDEFSAYIAAENAKALAEATAATMQQAFLAPINIHGTEFQITLSIGVALYPEHGRLADRLLTNADAAMYLVKRSAKNNFRVFTHADERTAKRNNALFNDFSLAFEAQELEMWYQPIYSADKDQLAGMESLLRWNHPQLGVIPPDRFLPLVEKHELMHRLGLWTVEEVLNTLLDLKAEDNLVPVAVNISPYQLLREDLIKRLGRFSAKHPDLIEYLIVEVTESFWLKPFSAALEQLSKLRKMDIKVYLDDFGTGYSSPALLKEFQIDGIKIDRSFVKDIDSNQQNYSITKAIIGIGQAFDLNVVAEGVETMRELDTVAQIGCSLFQGFLFDQPSEKEALFTKLEKCPPELKRLRMKSVN